MCYVHLPPYWEGLLHNIASITCVKFQYVKQYNSLYADKEFKQQFFQCHFILYKYTLVAHVLEFIMLHIN